MPKSLSLSLSYLSPLSIAKLLRQSWDNHGSVKPFFFLFQFHLSSHSFDLLSEGLSVALAEQKVYHAREETHSASTATRELLRLASDALWFFSSISWQNIKETFCFAYT